MTATFAPHALSLQRAAAYAFFADIFAAPLSAAALDDLLGAARRQHPGGFSAGLVACLVDSQDADLWLNLARDHARLFGGLLEGYGPKAPFASLWRSGEMMGPATTAVARAFAEAGYSPDCVAGPCDHITDLLAFMGWLASAEANGTLPRARALQQRFATDHLLPWVPAWAAEIQTQARQPFYATCAAVLTRFLRDDAEYLLELS